MQQLEQDYDVIAPQFASTRQAAWPEFALLEAVLQPSQQLLDMGCGSGRLAELAEKIKLHYTGLDFSANLLALAQQRHSRQRFIQGSMLALPLVDHTFDVITMIASLQHIPSLQLKIQCLDEAYRVSQPGAILFMTNWNLHQLRYQSYRANQADGFDDNDFLIPWKNDQGKILAQRYYHGFTIPELASLLQQTGWEPITQAYSSHQYNIVTLAKKVIV